MELNCRKLFDKQAALESVGDDAELLKEIAALFSREYTDSLSALANAIQSQNSSLIESTAHSLRSTIGYFGSELASYAALRLELLGRSGDLADASDLLAELGKIMTDLSSELAKI
jgi:HPt (histidine-containing phosphotransfer) domain-containing protein